METHNLNQRVYGFSPRLMNYSLCSLSVEFDYAHVNWSTECYKHRRSKLFVCKKVIQILHIIVQTTSYPKFGKIQWNEKKNHKVFLTVSRRMKGFVYVLQLFSNPEVVFNITRKLKRNRDLHVNKPSSANISMHHHNLTSAAQASAQLPCTGPIDRALAVRACAMRYRYS